MSNRRGLMSISLEDNEVIESSVTDFVNEPEQEMESVNSAANDIENMEEQADTAANTADAISEIADRVEDSVSEGGMSESAIAALEPAVEALMLNIGHSRDSIKAMRLTGSMEDFRGDKASRIAATKRFKVALEEQELSIWQRFKAWFLSMLDKVKTFFLGLFDAAVKFGKRAEALAKAAAAIKEIPEDKKIKTSSFKILTVDGKFVDSGSLVSHYDKHTKDKAINNEYKDEVADLQKIINIVTKDPNSEETKKLIKDVFDDRKDENITNEFEFGGFSIVIEMNVRANTATVTKHYAEVKDLPEEVPAGDPKDIAKVCTEVARHLATYKSKQSASIGLLTKMTDAIKSVKLIGNTEAKLLVGALRAGQSAVVTQQSYVKAYDINVAKAVISYGALSIHGVK